MRFKLSILMRTILAAALCSGAAVYHASANNQDRLLMLAQATSTSSPVQGTAVAPATKKKKNIGKGNPSTTVLVEQRRRVTKRCH